MRIYGWDNGSASAINLALQESGGNVGIGTTNPSLFKLQVTGNVGPNATNSYNLGASGSNWGCLYYNSGTLGTCASDERLKENIEELSFGDDPLLKIAGLKLRTFSFISDESSSLYNGLIAQEVELVAPELVATSTDGFFVVKYGDIQWLIISAIQQLHDMFTDLAEKVAALFISDESQNSKIAALEARLAEVESQLLIATAGNASLTTTGGSGSLIDGSNETYSTSTPTIIINGNNPAEIEIGAMYSDLGASATVISANGNAVELTVHTFMDGVEVQNIALDTATSTSYLIEYRASYEGATATSTRTVIVGDNNSNTEALSTDSETNTNIQSTNDSNIPLESTSATSTLPLTGQAATNTPTTTPEINSSTVSTSTPVI